jgi:hypothetical protein
MAICGIPLGVRQLTHRRSRNRQRSLWLRQRAPFTVRLNGKLKR